MKFSPIILAALLARLVFSSGTPSPAEEGGKGSWEGTESIVTILPSIDVSCILRTWRIVGVDVCVRDGLPRACVIIENAYPVGILEAVRSPLRSHLIETDLFLKTLSPMIKAGGLSSSHTTDSGSGTGLQFSEAHAYQFVPQIPLLAQALPIVVPPGQPFMVSYLSEFDAFSWRNGFADMFLDPKSAARKAVLPACSVVPRTGDCAWSWGSFFPRTGFAIHPSEVMSAYLFSLRAGRVASRPLGRVVMTPYPYQPRAGHYVQMLRPSRRSCVSIGWPATRMIEKGALSAEGAYLFIHFGIFRECKGCYGPRLAGPRPPGP